MLKSFRSRLTFSNVLSMIALCVAMGGVSYAAVTLPKNSVGPSQIRRHAVKPSELAANSVRKRALSRGLRKQLSHSRVVRLHFSADARAGAPTRAIGTVNGLTLRAACRTTGGGTSLVFALRSKHPGTIQENFQNDFGSNPHSPGTMNTGNNQIDVPAGTMVLGGPPPVPSGYFRTIANLVFRTKQRTATLNVATVANGTTGHCTADGLGVQAGS